MNFGSVDDVLKHYGWEGEVKYSEVKKDDGSQGVSRTREDSKTTRNADKNVAEGVPEKHGDSL
ncbi:hypothetical protein J2W97_002232 [Paenibacillus jamilae]|nr:hypothetical protein [Paenibacillus jamilae]